VLGQQSQSPKRENKILEDPTLDIDNTLEDNILLNQKSEIDNSMLKDLGKN